MYTPYKSLKACLAIAPKDDVRRYLCGALLDVRERDITLVATNGHALIAVPIEGEAASYELPVGQYILPRSLLTTVKPISKAHDEIELTIADGKVSLRGAATVSGELVDGSFPDWRRVIPKEASGVATQFDPVVFGAIGDAFAAIGARWPMIHHNGQNGARVTALNSGVLGVIMPCRIDVPFDALPSWAI